MTRYIFEADRSNDCIIFEMDNEKGGGFTIDLTPQDALFIARRLLEELETFEGLSR
jgi:hypothetical protein